MTATRAGAFLLLVSLVPAPGCARPSEPDPSGGAAMTIELTSPAFREGETIPKTYTADGEDVSPPLRWGDPPAGTQSFALIADDPDAPRGTWVHWVLFDLPAGERDLAQGVPKDEALPNGAKQGTNDFHKLGYGGPSPPPGKPHRYFFKLYALDTQLALHSGVTKAQVEAAMKGHVLAEGRLMGKYGRP
jgi:Raf kinase inhibitor-like YbhB/YbcL family protein